MKRTLSIRARPLSVLALLWVWVPAQAAAQTDECLTDWGAASVIVKANALVPLADVARLATAKLGGEIVRSALCETPAGHVYRLVMRDARGQLTTITVDAAHPFGR